MVGYGSICPYPICLSSRLILQINNPEKNKDAKDDLESTIVNRRFVKVSSGVVFLGVGMFWGSR
jgi:hypothetical protein